MWETYDQLLLTSSSDCLFNGPELSFTNAKCFGKGLGCCSPLGINSQFFFLKGSTINMNVNNHIYSAFSKHVPSTESYKALGITLFVGRYSCTVKPVYN